jgi:hypothetical protein
LKKLIKIFIGLFVKKVAGKCGGREHEANGPVLIVNRINVLPAKRAVSQLMKNDGKPLVFIRGFPKAPVNCDGFWTERGFGAPAKRVSVKVIKHDVNGIGRFAHVSATQKRLTPKDGYGIFEFLINAMSGSVDLSAPAQHQKNQQGYDSRFHSLSLPVNCVAIVGAA